jgi:NAD(P)-dependent dehydrogenase (short-subunit alcohol dehydrogenase family)
VRRRGLAVAAVQTGLADSLVSQGLVVRLLYLAREVERVAVGGLGPLDVPGGGQCRCIDPMLEERYSGARAYQRSKLALAADSFRLAAELRPRGITANCVHPVSRMDTAMVRDSGVAPTATVAEGAEAVLRLVIGDSTTRTTAGFYDGMRLSRAHPQAYDPAFCARLGEHTAEWLTPYLN